MAALSILIVCATLLGTSLAGTTSKCYGQQNAPISADCVATTDSLVSSMSGVNTDALTWIGDGSAHVDYWGGYTVSLEITDQTSGGGAYDMTYLLVAYDELMAWCQYGSFSWEDVNVSGVINYWAGDPGCKRSA
jgi:hypothetical protein